jgi:2-dehydro-3-deoxyphosphogluconate aldolase/(4S)-4-hydroxy-2-oxoglutarate aldolase
VPALPGCYTPTEILNAWDAGADIVKVFPAGGLGPAYFKDVRAPLPHVKLMPDRGVSIDNAGEWIRAGAWPSASAAPSWTRASWRRGDFAAITERAARIVAHVRAARQRS